MALGSEHREGFRTGHYLHAAPTAAMHFCIETLKERMAENLVFLLALMIWMLLVLDELAVDVDVYSTYIVASRA